MPRAVGPGPTRGHLHAPIVSKLVTGAGACPEKDRSSHQYHSRARVMEDVRKAGAELQARGRMCDRIAHAEGMTST
eukprot:7156892-Pyramimonas_sp.AAC.1